MYFLRMPYRRSMMSLLLVLLLVGCSSAPRPADPNILSLQTQVTELSWQHTESRQTVAAAVQQAEGAVNVSETALAMSDRSLATPQPAPVAFLPLGNAVLITYSDDNGKYHRDLFSIGSVNAADDTTLLIKAEKFLIVDMSPFNGEVVKKMYFTSNLISEPRGVVSGTIEVLDVGVGLSVGEEPEFDDSADVDVQSSGRLLSLSFNQVQSNKTSTIDSVLNPAPGNGNVLFDMSLPESNYMLLVPGSARNPNVYEIYVKADDDNPPNGKDPLLYPICYACDLFKCNFFCRW